jgi:hypothetical protein
LNYLRRRSNILIKVWALQKYLIQELAHLFDVRNCSADKISSAFRSNLVVPVINVDFKCSCENEIRYLDLAYFSELWPSKEAMERFLVAVQITYAFPQHVLKSSLLTVLWLKIQVGDLGLFRGPDGSASRTQVGGPCIKLFVC